VHVRDYDDEIIEIEIENGQTLALTPNHEIYVQNRGWIKAGEVVENDEVLIF